MGVVQHVAWCGLVDVASQDDDAGVLPGGIVLGELLGSGPAKRVATNEDVLSLEGVVVVCRVHLVICAVMNLVECSTGQTCLLQVVLVRKHDEGNAQAPKAVVQSNVEVHSCDLALDPL